MSVAAVSLSDVDVVYGRRRRALTGASVVWPERGVVGLLGPNGAGKSTLFKLLMGEVELSSGTASRPPVARIGYLPQAADWPGRFTVAELVEYSAWWRGVARHERADAVQQSLSRVGLTDVAGSQLRALSGGQRQRAMLAQVIVHQPPVLLLDEPSAGLDLRARANLRDLVQELAADALVVMATHLVEDFDPGAHWVTILDEGSVRFDGDAALLESQFAGSRSSVEAAYLALVNS